MNKAEEDIRMSKHVLQIKENVNEKKEKIINQKKIKKNLKPYKKMDEEIIKFNNTEIK